MAELKLNTGVLVVIGIVLIAFLWNAGVFESKTSPEPSANVPSDLSVTVTLNTRNALSATGANANVSYYIFGADGKYVTEGTTAAGTASVSLNALASYQILTLQATTYAPKVTAYTVPSGVGSDTIAIDMYPLATPVVDSVQDALGDTTDSNITLGLGAQKGFKIYYSAGNASSEVYKPVIVVDYNTSSTAASGIAISGLSTVTCPDRLTTATGRSKVCFQDASLKTANSPMVLSGSVKASDTITPGSNDVLTFTVIDTMMYANPNYKSVGISAFVEGTQNANDKSNVGTPDSNSKTITYD